ncbi:uncharacterized protein LOC119958365 isoform X5 [Scyliorhinus canicula]|uniref:uncharacterized protein LOC119958365 isoform X5 n=1 Tax=Scyliorhinus canicula TaxID=7830 RepID=UPI0018F57292|nr:uncharacterized protein LOC119958365 isoform X5 [Scyliorhinus canicula]
MLLPLFHDAAESVTSCSDHRPPKYGSQCRTFPLLRMTYRRVNRPFITWSKFVATELILSMASQFASSMGEILPAIFLLSLGLLLNFGRAQDRLPKPTISFEPVTGIALEGGIIIIKCAVNINDPKLIYIFRGQEMVFNSTQDSNETAVFTIGNVTSTNRGIYRCIYDLLVPIQRRSGLSNVIRLTVHRTKAPLSILHPADVEVNAGVTLNMSCSTARNGRCFYYQDSKFQLAEGRNNVTVSIKNISFCDEGNYTCYCLVEVNNSTVFSARSNIMQVAVSGKLTDRPEAKNKVTTEASEIAMSRTHIPDETELQDISD